MINRIKIDNYMLEKIIGKGQHSDIFFASKDQTSEKFAIKKYVKELLNDTLLQNGLKNEIILLKKISHPNIIKFEDIKKTKYGFYLIYEYCNGEKLSKIIQDYIQKYKKQISEEIVQYLMKQIIDIIGYMKSKGIFLTELDGRGIFNYDSINLNNMLINFDSEKDKENINLMNAKIKMINFKKAYKDDDINTPYDFFVDDTRLYKKTVKKREDTIIFCLGKMCYELLTGKSPFEGNNHEEIFQKIEEGNYFIPNNLSIEAINFLNSTLQNTDKFRVSLDDLFKLDFLCKNVKDFHFCDFNNMIKIDRLNLNIKGIIVNINNNKDKEVLKINEKEKNNELSNKENPFNNLKDSVEININKND